MNEQTLNYMEEVIKKLQDIENKYEKDIPQEYTDRIIQLWCDMQDDISLETTECDEEMPVEEPSYGYSYEQYLREIR